MSVSCSIPRVMISSPSSSSGKTTVVCALLALFDKAAAIKCGPDFIDPLFHRTVRGAHTGNVDLFFSSEDEARAIFAHDVQGADIAVCEGAMGYYDGVSGGEEASAYAVARALLCPVILVVDAKGKSLSLCAEINGFASFREQKKNRSGICGVILNRCSRALYETLAPRIQKECGIPAVGYLENLPDIAIESRHLGLVTPDAVPDVQGKLAVLAAEAKKTLDTDAIFRIAARAPSFVAADFPGAVTVESSAEKVRIAVAEDEAFCFYYRENRELLASFGAELVPFSPLRDTLLPAGCRALYLGGGYPELFPLQLAENTTMLQNVRAFCRSGAPVFAECGGFLYLKLAGVLAGTFENTGHLVRFGYVTLTAQEDTLLGKSGTTVRAHEFHYTDTTHNGTAFFAEKPNGKTWQCIESAVAVPELHPTCCQSRAGTLPNIIAGFPHWYFPSNPEVARNFVAAARAYAARRSCTSCGGCASCPS